MDCFVAGAPLRKRFAFVAGNDGAFSRARISALIMSAAFSPIMMVGALVLPPISVGMIEASTTRRRATPCTLSAGSTTAKRIVHAHLAGADRVVDRVDAIAQARCGCRRRYETPLVKTSLFCSARSAGARAAAASA